MNMLVRALGAVAVITACTATASAQTANWPNRQIRMVVPYTPGGYTDMMARLVSEKIAASLGQSIVIENKPGANAAIGTDIVAKAAPDGYTFGTVIAAHSVNPSLKSNLPYNTEKDFTYVSLMSVAPLIIVATPSLPAKNMQEFIALAKAKPGTLNFASSGIGSAAHLTMEMLKSREGINLQHVPYKGTAGALQDLIGGQINVMFDIIGPLMEQVRGGTARALGVASKERVPAAGDTPTLIEQGVKDFTSGTWAGIIAPAGVPKEIVDRMAAEAKKALADPDLRKKLEQQGIVAMGSSPEEFKAFVGEEIARWKQVITAADIKAE